MDVRLADQCAGRTDCHALSAINATGNIESFIEGGSDGRLRTASDEVDAGNALNFLADSDAFSTFDAFVGIADDGIAGHIERMDGFVSIKSAASDAEFFGQCLELAISVALAVEAVFGMIGEQEFDDHSSCIDGSR